MKISKPYLQTFIFVIVYLFAIYFWSQPYQIRKMPYGEYDAMSHFEVADYTAYHDKSFMQLPSYIDLRYGIDNDFKPHTLWYPPAFHSSLAIGQIIGGERVVSVFLMNTVMATFILISIYFVINSLFGFLPAILSSILIVFSPRDFMPYLWGQWPERFGYGILPLVLYCFYKYYISYSKNESKPIYLYLTALLGGMNFLVHPLGFFHAAAGIFVLYILLAIKRKKLVFDWKHFLAAFLIFVAIFMMFPYQTLNVFKQISSRSAGAEEVKKAIDISRVFQWSLNPKDYEGSVPSFYFSFKDMHGIWTLPFLLIGIGILIYRREEKDIFLLAWLISLYLLMHRDIIGKTTFLHRSLSASAHIFSPLTAIGAVYLASLIKLPSNFNKILKYGLVAIFLYLTFTINMKTASALLNKETYNDFFSTLTKEQYDAAEWILKNTDPRYNVSVIGLPHQEQVLSATSKKIRWSAAVSQHVSRFYLLVQNETEAKRRLKDDYIMLDYTMIEPIGEKMKPIFDIMQQMEKNDLANYSLLYNKNSIKVYKLANK